MNPTHRILPAVFLACLLLPIQALAGQTYVVIGFNRNIGPAERLMVERAGGTIDHIYDLIRAMAVSLPEEALEDIRTHPAVTYVEEDGLFEADATEYTAAWGVGHISAEAAHMGGHRGAGINIAVIDTGIDYTHEDLDDNYAGGYDFVFSDEDPYDDNVISHGTHVAGTIAAELNGIGVAGVAPGASLYALKVLDGAGFGLLSWIIAGIQWSVDNGMDIVNLSLQGPHFQSLQDACDSAYDAGLLLVAAAGNTNGGSVTYPAAYDSVIAVTGTDAGDLPGYFAPTGPQLELAAPGVDVLSTVSAANGSYALLSGTSQAAPHVSGAAALILAMEPADVSGNGFVNDEVRELLKSGVVDLGTSGHDSVYGYGLLDLGLIFTASEPTVIRLARFEAEPAGSCVRVVWETESEIDTAGFNLYRADRPSGEYRPVNELIIPAQGSPSQGASYIYIDRELKNRRSCWYLLEDVDTSGETRRHGPVRGTPSKVLNRAVY